MRPLSADSIIIKEGKILLIKRKNEPFKGMWAFPGGLIMDNETMEQCAVREAKEETGLDVKPIRLIGVYSDPKRDPRKVITAAYLCEIVGGEVFASSDAEDIIWFDLDSVPELAADHNKILEDL